MSDEPTQTRRPSRRQRRPRSSRRRSTSSTSSPRARRAERDEYLDALQRLKAEFDNYRKRVARDQESLVARAPERLVKQLLPVLDDLERALEAAAEHEEAKLEDGVRLVHRALADALAREGLAEIETDGRVRPARARGAALAAVRASPRATVIQVLQKGYRLGDRVLRPARVVSRRRRSRRTAEPRLASLYETLGVRRTRRPTSSRRRTASSRASTTRTRTRATRRRRSGSRRCRTPTTSSPTRRSASSTTRFGSANGAAAGPGRRTFDFGDFDLGDIFGGLFGGGRGAAAAGAAARPARLGRRGRGQPLVRGLAEGRSRRRCPSTLELACHTCHGTGAAPGTAPKRCPQCDGTRRRRDVAGPVRAAAAVPALPRQRHDRRDAVPDLPRLRPRAADEALHGEDPGRRQGRHEDPAQGQGRGRLGRRARRRPVTSSRGSSRRSSTSAAATTSCSTCRSPSPRPRSARPSRSRRPTAACR